MRLLVIEDDPSIIRSLASTLKDAGFAVDVSQDGENGCFMALTNSYDLIILDCNLPKLSGQEVVARLRAEGRETPILILTVRTEINNKVDLLNLGADDYLTKPFVLSELLARVKAILRRPKSLPNRILKMANLTLDRDKLSLTKNGEGIRLSAKEFSLLEYLLVNKGRVLPRQEIMEHVWDENADPFSNTIEVHIMKLRRKIEGPGEQFIFTFSNRGYKIDDRP